MSFFEVTDAKVAGHVDTLELGGLARLATPLSSEVACLKGVLAADFDHVELRELFGEDAIEVGEALTWPRRKDLRTRVRIADPRLVRFAFEAYPNALDWSYEHGLLRDVIATDKTGEELWGIDPGTGVLTVNLAAKSLCKAVRELK